MHPPSHGSQHRFLKDISLPDCASHRITVPVALDPREKRIIHSVLPDGDIHPASGRADVPPHRIALLPDELRDRMNDLDAMENIA